VTKRIALLSVVVISAIVASAQQTQRFETFGGYSLTNDGSFFVASTNGWDTSTTVFLNRWLGFTTDFSGHYGSGVVPVFATPGAVYGEKQSPSSYTYMAGPHFTYRRSRYAPFVQTLFGVYHTGTASTPVVSTNCSSPPYSCSNYTPISPNGSFSVAPNYPYTKFALAAGGGLDIALRRGISIRPIQMEYLLLREPGVNFSTGAPFTYNYNTFRFSTGMTFRFGPHIGSAN
jgi:hypothetical protein